MKRKRGVAKAAADNENAVVLVPPELDKPEVEPEDPAVVEWNAFAQDHYELVEQLPLSLHRSYSLMRELDELAQNNTALIVPATRAYISLRDSVAHKPRHRRAPSGLDLLAHVSASVEPPTTAPVPNLTTETQESALEAVNGLLNEVEMAPVVSPPTTSALESAPVEPSPVLGSTQPLDSVQASEPTQPDSVPEAEPPAPAPETTTSSHPPEPTFPQDSRKLLTLIATLATDAVRASSEKLGIANAVYHTVDNHLTALNTLIAQHKSTLPRQPTPTPPPEPSSPVAPTLSPSLKIRTRRKDPQVEHDGEDDPEQHETLPPLRLTRTAIPGSTTPTTTIRIRNNKAKPRSTEDPNGTTRPRSASTSKTSSAGKSGPTPRNASGSSTTKTGRSNKPPGKNKKGGQDAGEGQEEPLYCTCRKVSYGEMIACDGVDCPWEWFHLPCVGLTKAPDEDLAWFCTDCATHGRKRRRRA